MSEKAPWNTQDPALLEDFLRRAREARSFPAFMDDLRAQYSGVPSNEAVKRQITVGKPLMNRLLSVDSGATTVVRKFQPRAHEPEITLRKFG